ncbi:MAG: type II CAAX prenyl endopeptidase Rce1 family protein [Bacteroidia bacterium]
MQKLKQYLLDFWKEDFHLGYYLSAFLFVSLCIFLNYFYYPLTTGSSQTIERALVSAFYFNRSLWCAPSFVLFYAVPYYVTTLLYYLWKKDSSFLKQPEFWTKSLLAIVLMSLDVASHLYQDIAAFFKDTGEYYWVRKCLSTGTKYLYIGLPLFVYWYFRDKKEIPHFYGLTFKTFDWKPYLLLVVIILPFLFLASFQKQFTDYYPTLKWAGLDNFTWFPKTTAFAIYEAIYGFFFTWTEVMMRGFLVIGMIKVMGKNAVVPMAVMYAFRHFAKPWGETLSSVVGGYVLGAFAFKSRNVVGGVILHATVAVGMDVFALLHILSR